LEVIKNIGGSYGGDTRNSLGDVAESFLFGGVSSSILVVQSKKVSNTINNENDVNEAIIETGLSKSNIVIV
jgi:signal-transduction protein with cAMP-binding, CBS, and nucleotidyltransferase domain